jgi:hypothetical protein
MRQKKRQQVEQEEEQKAEETRNLRREAEYEKKNNGKLRLHSKCDVMCCLLKALNQ